MKTAVIVTRVLTSLLGISLLTLGILFWLGRALTLLNVHMALGAALVLCLCFLVVLGLRTRGSRGFSLLVLGWSVLMPWFGVEQMRLLPGEYHWVIQALHLAVGVAAVGFGQLLARRLTPPEAQTSPGTEPA
jgi:hypothetical protein